MNKSINPGICVISGMNNRVQACKGVGGTFFIDLWSYW